VLHQGQILDGRNRYRACIEVGLFKPSHDPRVHLKRDSQHFLDLPRTLDPLNFVISKNLRRRHLGEGARAMAAAKIANMRQGERTDTEPSANLRKVSQADAARMLNVSERSVTDAVKVIKKGSKEIAAAVTDGKLSVSQAAVAADLDAANQAEVAKTAMAGNKKSAVDKIKKAAKRRPKKKARWGRVRTEESPTSAERQLTTSRNLRLAVAALTEISTEHGLKHTEGCECQAVPEFLLNVVSYEDLRAAYGLLSDLKYAEDRKQDEAKVSAPIMVETGSEPDTTSVVTDAELAGAPVSNQGPVLPVVSVTAEAV
jgi:hypothetical protein